MAWGFAVSVDSLSRTRERAYNEGFMEASTEMMKVRKCLKLLAKVDKMNFEKSQQLARERVARDAEQDYQKELK